VRARPALIRLLSLLLLLQWGTAFAHCLALAAPADQLHIEICTAEGLRSVALPAGDTDAPAEHPGMAGFCPACAGPAALALPAPAIGLAPPLLLAQAADPPPPSTPGPAPSPSCRPPPRAPPTS
jgi:hypothetical protein